VFWFWLFAGPALALAAFSLRGERKRARFVSDRLNLDADRPSPPATVITSIEDAEGGEDLRQNLAVLADQDYPNYELIVAARSASDIPSGVLPSGVIVVLRGIQKNSADDRV